MTGPERSKRSGFRAASVGPADAASALTSSGRAIVAADVVELSPIPGIVAPNVLCAKLIYKVLTYRFAADPRAKRI